MGMGMGMGGFDGWVLFMGVFERACLRALCACAVMKGVFLFGVLGFD